MPFGHSADSSHKLTSVLFPLQTSLCICAIKREKKILNCLINFICCVTDAKETFMNTANLTTQKKKMSIRGRALKILRAYPVIVYLSD